MCYISCHVPRRRLILSLAVIDDSPRDEFPPRQRHTLKEFAAIAMREMELWRDKIQLRVRDRIQTSVRAIYLQPDGRLTIVADGRIFA